MKVDTIIRSFLIAILVSLIALIIEGAYYGLRLGNTDVLTAGFVNNYSDLTSPVNIIFLAIIFISSLFIALSKISKKEKI
ncbi:hypothetical protein [Methanosarcina barkeri]|uniref:Uncharacterized protein n=1 Tax=Methanosarcina barkeri (strain Fusaro / DSM 804) TaxID=269797 RepID=Q467Q7_METBF|nr:hypothetical protein [Methanosarcina barkeri]